METFIRGLQEGVLEDPDAYVGSSQKLLGFRV